MPRYVKLIILDNADRVLSHPHERQLDLPTVRVRGGNPRIIAEKYAGKFHMRLRDPVIVGTDPDAWYFVISAGTTDPPRDYEWRGYGDFSVDTLRQRIVTAIKKRKKSQS